jgi:hypothetical protein
MYSISSSRSIDDCPKSSFDISPVLMSPPSLSTSQCFLLPSGAGVTGRTALLALTPESRGMRRLVLARLGLKIVSGTSADVEVASWKGALRGGSRAPLLGDSRMWWLTKGVLLVRSRRRGIFIVFLSPVPSSLLSFRGLNAGVEAGHHRVSMKARRGLTKEEHTCYGLLKTWSARNNMCTRGCLEKRGAV